MMHPPAYMNEILFGQKNFLNNKENFLLLTPYMLTNNSSLLSNNDKLLTGSNLLTDSNESKKKQLEFNKDTLFWSIFVAVNGEQEYYKLKHGGHNMVNTMMNLNKEISDYFNKNPGQLKLSNHRITLAKINEIKCNLMTKSMDTIESCIPCAIYFNRPIVVYFPEYNSHVRFVSKNYVSDDDDQETIYLTLTNNKIILKKPENGLGFELYHYEKPLQGASNYKGDELKNIYNQIFAKGTLFPTCISAKGTCIEAMNKSEYFENIMVKCSSVLQTKLR